MTLGFIRTTLLCAALIIGSGPATSPLPAKAEEAPEVLETKEEPQSLPAGVSQDWWSVVQQDIAQSEYHIRKASASQDTTTGETWQAPNRSQNFRTLFEPTGIRVIPRTHHGSEAPPWEWGLTLTAWGMSGSMQSAWQQPQLQANGNRMEYRHAGITEWYVNDTRGLEQGFTIDQNPDVSNPQSEASVARGFLRVEMQVTGNVHAQLTDANMAVDFFAPGGARVIHFNGLHTVDSAGNVLPCWFEVCDEVMSDQSAAGQTAQRLSIVVNDANAVYPIIIDPLATSPNWTAESNQSNANFGISVATAGDVNGDGFSDVIVGAYLFDNGQTDEGRAYVYHGSSSGLSATANWTAESNQANAWFGISVATAGDVNGDGFSDVIIGASGYDNGQTDEGRAYVYHGSATGLSATANWNTEVNQTGAFFGTCVSTAGDVNGDGFSDVIIGASGYDNGQTDEGRAYVYHGSASGLSAIANWNVESNQANALFGNSVATAGDVNGDGFSDVIIGAHWYDNGQTNEGRAYVYHGSASGLSATANWTAESDQANANFGYSVATAGDVNGDGYSDVIIGAYLFDNGQTDEGRAFVYHGSSSGLSATPNWTAESNQANSYFGISVFTAGDTNGDGFSDVIIGALFYDNGQTDEGRAYMYHGSPSGLSATPNWTAESNQAGASFGRSVATAGDVNGDGFSDVIVGAYLFDNGQADEGQTYVYHGSASGLSATPNWTAESNQWNSEFGISVQSAGDVNGDGFSDVIVGAPRYDNGQIDEGRAYVFYGAASGLSVFADWIGEVNHAGALFGRSASTAGDVNGDGYSDVIIGASGYDNGQTDEGRAYVYHGSSSGLSPTANWTAESNQANAWFGISVATAGDVNGDGFSDVIIGASLYDNDQTNEGRAYVFHGSSSGLSATPNWTAESNQTGSSFGLCVSTASDVNGDGFSDVIVGASYYDNGQTDEGRAYVYHGSASGLSAMANWTAESNQANALFGTSVATAGDVNGDGFSDVIVGAEGYTNGQSGEGRAYVYHGSSSGLSVTPNWTAESNQATAFFGTAVSTAGDVNGDGFSDVIVGADYYSGIANLQGRAYVYHGSASGLNAIANWTADGASFDDRFGGSVAAAGDVNGDGYSDVIVGAYAANGVNGGAYVYYGNQGPGRVSLPRQQTVLGIPIAPLGMSDSTSQFRVRFNRLSAFGRTNLRSQYEVKPLGVLFNGQNLLADGFLDTGSSGLVSYTRVIGGLTVNTLYHWRIRTGYDMVKTPFQKFGPWIHVPTNGWNEHDLRTAGIAPTGACCLPEGSCGTFTQFNCESVIGGTYQGNDVLCATVSCPQPCLADVAPSGGDGVVGVPDLLFIINNWGACPNPFDCPADISPPPGDTIVGVPDLLAVINAWGPCP